MKSFAAGQKAILATTYDATAATAAADEIRRLIGITFARATIKYSSTMKLADGYEAGPHAEGFCYWRAMAGSRRVLALAVTTQVTIEVSRYFSSSWTFGYPILVVPVS